MGSSKKTVTSYGFQYVTSETYQQVAYDPIDGDMKKRINEIYKRKWGQNFSDSFATGKATLIRAERTLDQLAINNNAALKGQSVERG